jgi:hypothetical protein
MVNIYRCYEGVQCLHSQGHVEDLKMKMKEIRPHDKSVTIYQSKRRDIPVDMNLHNRSMYNNGLSQSNLQVNFKYCVASNVNLIPYHRFII